MSVAILEANNGYFIFGSGFPILEQIAGLLAALCALAAVLFLQAAAIFFLPVVAFFGTRTVTRSVGLALKRLSAGQRRRDIAESRNEAPGP
ncbi:hypothetical protein [Paenarthrobacter sp. C1]|uniref:hypothetical protein n=1 Tax=Paenarthrobacter sp. C1 TaxID=3400220 RepID=UPI003BF4DD71